MDSTDLTLEVLRDIHAEVRTTNERVGSTNERLDSTNERLGSLSERLDSTNEHLGSLSERLDSTNERLGSLSERLDGTNRRLNSLTERMAAGFTTLTERVDRLERRQAETEIRLATELVGVAGAVREVRDLLREDRGLRERVDDHERRLRRIEQHAG